MLNHSNTDGVHPANVVVCCNRRAVMHFRSELAITVNVASVTCNCKQITLYHNWIVQGSSINNEVYYVSPNDCMQHRYTRHPCILFLRLIKHFALYTTWEEYSNDKAKNIYIIWKHWIASAFYYEYIILYVKYK